MAAPLVEAGVCHVTSIDVTGSLSSWDDAEDTSTDCGADGALTGTTGAGEAVAQAPAPSVLATAATRTYYARPAARPATSYHSSPSF